MNVACIFVVNRSFLLATNHALFHRNRRHERYAGLFRFVDDVEFLFNEELQRIDVRSASRVGYWDMGANRKRIEEIRRMMAQGVSSETNP